jgi:carbon-monoxide dehydrogenase small subunit
MAIDLTVNGERHTIECSATAPLVEVLRDHLGLTGTKAGCEVGYCGACTVLLDGRAAHSCCMVAGDCDGLEITTIEGLGGDAVGAVVQGSFVRRGAIQCGYCTPGFVVSAVALLRERRRPDRGEIRGFLSGNMCRCTGYVKLVDAIAEAGEEVSGR